MGASASVVDKASLQIGGRRYDARRGWSNRQVQRMAVKKRNQARHRKACRGRA